MAVFLVQELVRAVGPNCVIHGSDCQECFDHSYFVAAFATGQAIKNVAVGAST